MNPGRKESLLNSMLVVVGLCAMATTSMAAYRSFRPARPTPLPPAVKISDWQRYGEAGNRMGPAGAPVTIVEFSDFQCPFCRTAAKTLKTARENHGGNVAVVYRHYPLERIHPFARAAAIASECAGRQGRFEQYHDRLFAEDSLKGVKWARLAARAGVPDTAKFAACLKDPSVAAAVDRDVEAAAELKAQGTPTILINQYRLTTGAPPAVVDSLIRLALSQR